MHLACSFCRGELIRIVTLSRQDRWGVCCRVENCTLRLHVLMTYFRVRTPCLATGFGAVSHLLRWCSLAQTPCCPPHGLFYSRSALL